MSSSDASLERYCNTNLEHSVFSPQYNTDPGILFVNGTIEEVNQQLRHLLTADLSGYDSLRVDIREKVVKASRPCFFFWTLILTSIMVLPLFWLCTDCWKRMAFRLTEVRVETYQLVQQLLKRGRFEEFFLNLDDSYMDEEKVELLGDGVRTRVGNFALVNRARHFNATHNNADDFQKYARRHLGQLKNVECSWEKTFFTSQQML